MRNYHRLRLIGAAGIGLALLVGYGLLSRGYGETSEKGYQYATALFSACNQADENRLREISKMIDQSVEAGELDAREAGWLSAIIDQGMNGKWDAATRNVRQLMDAQIRRAGAG
jgi:hypothetical protein